jgi:hypothetical protein
MPAVCLVGKPITGGSVMLPPQQFGEYMPVIKSYALAKVRFIGKTPVNKDTKEPKPHVKDGISFEPSEIEAENWIKDVPYEKATAMVRRWPDIYEFVSEDDATAKGVIDKLMERIEELEKKAEEKSKPGRPKKDD